MSKIKAFFYIFFKSLSSVRYYQDIIETNTAFSMKYFFILAFLASLVVVSVNISPKLPGINTTLNNIIDEGRKAYPDDLVITSKGGTLSINKPEPFFIPVPAIPDPANKESGFSFPEEEYPENLVVFDSNGTLDDLKKYKTLILINSANILAQQNNKIEVYPLKDLPEGEFTSKDVDEAVIFLRKLTKFVPFIFFGFALIGVMFYYMVFRLIYLAFVAFVLWVISKIRQLEMEYAKSFKIAIHTFTLPLLVEIIISIAKVPVNIPFWFFLLNLLFGIIIMASLPKKGEVETGAMSESESKTEPDSKSPVQSA